MDQKVRPNLPSPKKNRTLQEIYSTITVPNILLRVLFGHPPLPDWSLPVVKNPPIREKTPGGNPLRKQAMTKSKFLRYRVSEIGNID